MIGLISDIHGNFSALTSVLNAFDKLGVKEIFCLGDIVGYYTQVNECCDELRRRNVHCIMGNHDWYLAGKSFCPRSQSVNDCMKYQRKIISEDNFNWIASLPIFNYQHGISMVHGGWCDPIDEYLVPEDKYFNNIEGLYFASGHTHFQEVKSFFGKKYCNPGSVGQPRDSNPKAAFATFDGENFFLHRVDYNIDKVGELMEKAGFSGYYYGCLKTGASRLQWADY